MGAVNVKTAIPTKVWVVSVFSPAGSRTMTDAPCESVTVSSLPSTENV